MTNWAATDQDDEPRRPSGPAMFTYSRLKLRGWTDKLIKDLLGEPDECRPQPNYPERAPFRLYLATRVEAIEDRPAFQKAQRAAKKKAASTQKLRDGRMEVLREQIEAFDIQLLKLSPGELAQLSREGFNAWAQSVGTQEVTPESSPIYQNLAKVHFLKLSVPGYEELFTRVINLKAPKELRRRLVERVLQQIALSYPDLAWEAERQNKRRLFLSEKEQAARDKRTAVRKKADLDKKKAQAQRRVTPKP